MPGPCIAFQSVDNFGNIFYPKGKNTAWPLLFSIESVTKVVNRLKRTTWQDGPGIRLFALDPISKFLKTIS